MPASPAPLELHVLLSPATEFGRGVLRGVSRFARTMSHWHLRRSTAEIVIATASANAPPRLAFIGHIGRNEQPVVDALRRIGAPAVNISNRNPIPAVPAVLNDDAEIGRLAAEHLLGLGFRHFAYFGFPGLQFSVERERGFTQRLSAAGFPCHVCSIDEVGGPHAPQLTAWVADLPRPAGVFCASDLRAMHLSESVEAAGLRVPDDVALIGVDDDPWVCELLRVPLSSVAPDFEQVGFLAGQLVHRLLAGRRAPRTALRVRPRGVVTRRSTDVIAVPDPIIAQVLALIRDRACEPLRVPDILAEVPLSRRPLEIRFRQALGRSLHDEIRRVQFVRARQMLTDPERRVLDVAHAVGFRSPLRFTTEFRKTFGVTPSAYRRARLEAPAR